jgi:hypothetical protein
VTVVRPAFDNVAMWPAGSVFSSAEDLARFAQALLAGGRIDGREVLPAGLFGRLAGEYVAMPGEPGVRYGYGVLCFEHREVRMVMHGGFSRGYGSMIQMAPAHGFALVVVTNSSGQTLPKTTEKAQALFLPRGPEPKVVKTALALAPGDVRRFVGTYVNGPQTWELRAVGDGVALVAEGETVPLTKTGEWRLSFGDGLENDVALVPGADGRAEYLFTGLYTGRRTSRRVREREQSPRRVRRRCAGRYRSSGRSRTRASWRCRCSGRTGPWRGRSTSTGPRARGS